MTGSGGIPGWGARLLDAYLRAAADGSAGEALHALESADAPRYRAGAWQCAADEDGMAFAARHRELHERGGTALPRFITPEPLAWRPEPEGESGILWFAATEAFGGRAVIGALGLRQTPVGPRIAWATLADRQADWSFADGRVRTLANFAWMTLAEPAAARTTLDAAWLRLHWLPTPPLTALPGMRFTCRGSSSCCRQDYIVAAPAAAQQLIDALPWARIAPALAGTKLPPLADERVEIKSREAACRFLGSRDECLLHAELGYQPFAACAAFPFSFARTPEGVAVTASRSCASVCESFGTTLEERETDIRQRLAIVRPRTTDRYRLAPEREVSWPVFRDTEALLRELLAREALPLYRRLYLGVRVLRARAAGAELRLDDCLGDAPAAIGAQLRAQLGDFLDRIRRWDRLALRDLPQSQPRDLRHAELVDGARIAAELRSLHFSKIYSYDFDLTTAHNLAIVLYLIALGWQRALPAGLDALRARELALLGSHGLLKSLLAGGSATPAYRALLGSPDFGEWLLASASP